MKNVQTDTVTFAIIGCGDVTEKKSGPAFQKVKGSALKTVMRRDAEKLRDYARRHHIKHYTTDYLEIMKDPGIDAVYIATPPDMHCFYTLEAAKYGKAVYVEKPMALTTAECRQMTAACEKAGVPLFTAYYRRGMKKFQTIRKILSRGDLGELRGFHYQYACPVPGINPGRSWLMDPEKAGGGMLYDIGSHMIDTLRFLFGEVDTAYGISTNQSGQYAVNDTHSIALRFAGGVQGTMQLTFCATEQKDEAIVYGSRGVLQFSIMDNDPITVSANGNTREVAFAPMEHVQQGLITQVVDTLLGKFDLESHGRYGLETQEILEAVDRNKTYRRNDGRQRDTEL
jgi:1,5-anhydro-D-fructose reductase (1,5-anhydro-D-mannitol-forming)